jgi:hypothetical protein
MYSLSLNQIVSLLYSHLWMHICCVRVFVYDVVESFVSTKYTPKRFQMVMYKKAYRNKRNTYPVTINVKEVQNLSCS